MRLFPRFFAICKLRGVRHSSLTLLFVFWLFACAAHALGSPQQNKPAPACARCHVSFASTVPQSGMGRALLLPESNTILGAHPVLTFTRGRYTYSVQTRDTRSIYSVTDGSRTLAVPILWSFGAGNQTWMLEYNGKVYESLVSYYADIQGLAVTTGDVWREPATLEEAMGRELSAIDVKTCFGCHASDPLPHGATRTSIPLTSAVATLPDPHTVHAGVNCEHCHLDAAAHALDISKGNFQSLPPSLSKLSSEEVSGFCGQCHRSWEMVVRSHWRGAMNVRFQPYRLENSACFNGTDARISCLACHNPHEEVVRDTSFYDKKCLACHTLLPASKTPPESACGTAMVADANFQGSSPSSKARSHFKACPVARTNCVSCHMPKVDLPGSGGHLTFTDHQIRVVKVGDAYPN